MNIFIQLDNEELGPMDRDQVFEGLMRGKFTPDSPARIGKDCEWKRLEHVLRDSTPDFLLPGDFSFKSANAEDEEPTSTPFENLSARGGNEGVLIWRDGSEHGPFGVEEIKAMLVQGDLVESDYIRTDTDAEWRSYLEFFGYAKAYQEANKPGDAEEDQKRVGIGRPAGPWEFEAQVKECRDEGEGNMVPRRILFAGVIGMLLAFGAACIFFIYRRNTQGIVEVSGPIAIHHLTTSTPLPTVTPRPVAEGTPVIDVHLPEAAVMPATATPAPSMTADVVETPSSTQVPEEPPTPVSPSASNATGATLAATRQIKLPATSLGVTANLWVADTVENPRAVLVICVDGNPQIVAGDKVWQKYALDNQLGLAAVSFSSVRKSHVMEARYMYVNKGSGNLLLAGLNQAFGKRVPIILYGVGGGGGYTANFVSWQSGRLILWAAYTNFMPPTVSESNITPGIIACDQDNGYGTAMGKQAFVNGRRKNQPWTLLRLTGPWQDRHAGIDAFVRDYITGTLGRKTESFGEAVWVDNDLRRRSSNVEIFQQPESASWVPNITNYSEWMNLTAPTGATQTPIIVERDIATRNPVQPTLKLYLRLPPGASDGRSVSGVLAYCTWENDEGAILKKLTGEAKIGKISHTEALMLPFLNFADQHNMAVLTWGTVDAWNDTTDTEELARREQREFDRNFDFLADAWGRGVSEFGDEIGIPQTDFLLYGISRGAQWAHRLALRKPGYFLAVHIHIPSTFDIPTPGGRQSLWLVTTGDREYGYPGAQTFYQECKDLGYPIIFKAIPGLGHSDNSSEHKLGFSFFDYALSVKDSHDAWIEDMKNPFRMRVSGGASPDTWLASIRNPPFYGDYLNQDLFPANQADMISPALRVPLPTRELAKFWSW